MSLKVNFVLFILTRRKEAYSAKLSARNEMGGSFFVGRITFRITVRGKKSKPPTFNSYRLIDPINFANTSRIVNFANTSRNTSVSPGEGH